MDPRQEPLQVVDDDDRRVMLSDRARDLLGAARGELGELAYGDQGHFRVYTPELALKPTVPDRLAVQRHDVFLGSLLRQAERFQGDLAETNPDVVPVPEGESAAASWEGTGPGI
jgi:hypothetical protein